ncbi:MAG: hypothetical protein Q9N62_04560 [Ghiorsea sp.]|nr:hypothetical protein [Ghiorsea sp.]
MINQISLSAKAKQGRASDVFSFIIGAAIVATGAYCLAWTTATIILAVLFLFILNFFRKYKQTSNLIARRIVAYVSVGDKIQVGQGMGGKIVFVCDKVSV